MTDIGRIRRQNEDRFLRADELGLYAVADGIGGLPGGAAAAQTTVAMLEELAAAEPDAPGDRLLTWVHAANEAVFGLSRRLSPIYGIGTTLTCGLWRDDTLWLAHVGDSRCYHLAADGTVRCLTEDHSVENDLKRRQARGEADGEPLDPRTAGALTRCIGQPDTPEVDLTKIRLTPGDRILFATDGITRVVSDEELVRLLTVHDTPTRRLAAVVDLANDRGGPDNATAVFLEFASAAPS